MVSKDRENIVRQWQDEDDFIDIDDAGNIEEDDEDEDEDARRAAEGPLCGLCRQPGHNRRTCPLRNRQGSGIGRGDTVN